MRLVLRLCLGVVLACCVGVVGARAVGGARQSFVSLLFTNPDGSPCSSPCLLGIQPEETPFEAVAAMMDAHAAMQGWDKTYFWRSGRIMFTGQIGSLNIVSGRNGRVHFISLTFDSPGSWDAPPQAGRRAVVSLGEVVAALGAPPRFQSLGRLTQGVAWSYYAERGLALQTRREDSQFIDVHDVLIGLFVTRNIYQSISQQPWYGFTGVGEYQDELRMTRN